MSPSKAASFRTLNVRQASKSLFGITTLMAAEADLAEDDSGDEFIESVWE